MKPLLLIPPAVPRRGSAWFSQVCSRVYRGMGWRFAGNLPNLPKFVVIGAPHTSNWDFPIVMLVIFTLRVQVSWMGKNSMFIYPFKRLLRWMGGIPVDRTARHGVVEQVADWFENSEQLIVVLAPEGTRAKVKKWKSGFYHMATKANVPIVMASLNFEHKTIGFSDPFYPTGDLAGDLVKIKGHYAGIKGKHPDRM